MKIDFKKYLDGLVPAVVQDADTAKVLMVGFMNEAALQQTLRAKKVTFFSRSKQRLWTKGEESGNYLAVKSVTPDCDYDTLLVKAVPQGPVCHTGMDTCFNEKNAGPRFMYALEKIISNRKDNFSEDSYTSKLFSKGINKIAQKVGEEAIELVIESKDENAALFKNEAADLLFHFMILLQAKGCSMADIDAVLEARHARQR